MDQNKRVVKPTKKYVKPVGVQPNTTADVGAMLAGSGRLDRQPKSCGRFIFSSAVAHIITTRKFIFLLAIYLL